ncbi:MAG: hypothetical protein M1814_000552 [Vezdaea aestivalis]|nr:MAG: hypothetical protein M1814_000552 [Vezdaea aestivalis]
MAKKCVHKGCGKDFSDENEACTYHPGPPIFHEGQKGWKCCKPRTLTFDEFMSIPPCTTGKHSTIDDTPVEAKKPPPDEADIPKVKPISRDTLPVPSAQARHPQTPPVSSSPAPPESDSDDPTLPIPSGKTCQRRGCEGQSTADGKRDVESCVHHPGQPIFHEGSKGWTCCKRRVLEFDEFMKIQGCKTKNRHLFVGSGKGKAGGVEVLESVRNDFYQTPASLIVSFYLKKIDAKLAKVEFSPRALDLDLPTTDKKLFKSTVALYGSIDTEKSSFKIMGTKLELTLVKPDGASWPVLRSDDRHNGEIIQVGRAGKA